MAKTAPTLIDHLYRATFRNEPTLGWTNHAKMRAAFQSARRFVLDDEMSTFLGELGTQAFVNLRHRFDDMAQRNRLTENLRIGARLPFPTTWIEYNLRNCQTRSHALLHGWQTEEWGGVRPFDPNEIPKTEGWLLQQHPHLDTAIIAHLFSHDTGKPDHLRFDTWMFPVAIAWTVDTDTVLPWRTLQFDEQQGLSGSEAVTGMVGYRTDRVGYVASEMIRSYSKAAITELIQEWKGVARRMFALLSTIADLPVLATEVRAAKGFVARGQYRKFLDHKTVTLTVPVKEYKKVIRTALALAHRRGGPVRAHWRKDWRNPLSPLCDHEFVGDELHMTCSICKGRKSHVKAHERGDSGRGFVTHDYQVTHDPDQPQP